ncbi:hypothetical protein GLE_4709 [Lysobacter enzymogenes]|uniref:Uncharacterized protein n=1 Tax=Lysobacter enzymogenes TaxID=69 RepID=A0A0S2DN99_LYSEN|nr:hypothetical protein GLE_4709 [Lysobacter enzymogenes]
MAGRVAAVRAPRGSARRRTATPLRVRCRGRDGLATRRPGPRPLARGRADPVVRTRAPAPTSAVVPAVVTVVMSVPVLGLPPVPNLNTRSYRGGLGASRRPQAKTRDQR